MTVKIGNITKFMTMPAGMALNLPGDEKRKVRLEVNCETDARFDVVLADGAVIFLAKVNGHNTIEFVAEGPCQVQPTSEGEVWLSTDEGPHLVYETDERSFVELDFTKSAGLTEFERMQAIANLRREQREQETIALLDQLRAEREALEGAKNDATKEKPSDDNSGGSGAPPAGDSGKSEPASEGAAADDGTAPGTGGAAKPAK